MKLCMPYKIFLQVSMGVKEALNQQNLYTISLAWPWRVRKSLFHFSIPNGKGVTCICLQCGRRK